MKAKEKKINPEIIELVERGFLEIYSYKDGGEMLFKVVDEPSDQNKQKKKPTIGETIKRLEADLYRLTNNGFPIPYEKLDNIFPELSEKSKWILLEFSGWIGQNKILLEVCSQFDFSFLFGIYHQLEIQNKKLSSKQKKKLDEIIKIHLGLRKDLLKK